MGIVKYLIGDAARFAGLFYAYNKRSTIGEAFKDALDYLTASDASVAAQKRVKDAWVGFVRRMGIAQNLLVIGTALGLIFGVAAMASTDYAEKFGNAGMVIFAFLSMLSLGIMGLELVKTSIIKQIITVFLVLVYHGGAVFKQLLPQIIVGNWDGSRVLRECHEAAEKTVETLYTIYIGANAFVLFVLLSSLLKGNFLDPISLFITVIVCFFATAWAIRFTKNVVILKYVSAAMIVATFMTVLGGSAWAAYKRTDAYRASLVVDAGERVKNGIEKADDKSLVGDDAYEDLTSKKRVAAMTKAVGRILAGTASSADRTVLGTVVCADLDAIVKIRLKSDQDDCDAKEMQERLTRAQNTANGLSSLFVVHDCNAVRARAKEAEAKKIADEKKAAARAAAAAKEQQAKTAASGPTGTSVASAGSPSPALAPTANPWTAFRAQHGLH